MTHCTIRNPYAPLLEPTAPKPLANAIRVLGNAERVEISHCTLRALVGIEVVGGPFRRCRTLFNTYHPEPKTVGLYGTASMGWIVGENCIVEGNLCEYSNRGFTCGPWFGPVEHNFIARNVVSQGGIIGGAGESFLFECGSAGRENWWGHPSKVGPKSLEQSDKKWKPHQMAGRIALVVHGKGFGQFRVIAGNSPTQITLAQPWNIMPDKNSWVVVRPFVFENLILNNSSRNTKGGLEMGGGLGNVIDRFIASRSRHGIWFMGENVENDPQHMPYGPIAFNEVRNGLFLDCGSYDDTGGAIAHYSGIKFWSTRLSERMQPIPMFFGNRLCNNKFDHCGILTEDRVLQSTSGSWLPPEDSRRKEAPPAFVYNAIGGNLFRGNSAEKPDIQLDRWTAATLLWLPKTLGGDSVKIKDDGKSTVKMP